MRAWCWPGQLAEAGLRQLMSSTMVRLEGSSFRPMKLGFGRREWRMKMGSVKAWDIASKLSGPGTKACDVPGRLRHPDGGSLIRGLIGQLLGLQYDGNKDKLAATVLALEEADIRMREGMEEGAYKEEGVCKELEGAWKGSRGSLQGGSFCKRKFLLLLFMLAKLVMEWPAAC
ncbi:hypothetical protein U1Q18_006809 [Sarracenia purpurea var. burkii]